MTARLYTLDVTPLFGGEWRERLDELPPERRAKALRMAQDADAARCVGAGLALNCALLDAGIASEKQIFTQNEYGKPVLLGENAPHFSLSHSGKWAVCAISDAPVGADIDTARCTMKIARRFFSKDEVEYLEPLPEKEQKDALARLWTAKEAYLKARGTGLSAPLDTFTVELSEHGAAIKNSPYRLREYRLGEYYLCVCSLYDEIKFMQ